MPAQKEFADQLRLAMNVSASGVPNLDGLSTEPGDLTEASRVFLLLSKYAKYKSIAMRCRMDGQMAQALQFERICEYHYGELPPWARW